MSIQIINTKVYRCHCEAILDDGKPCNHTWDSFEIPKRCAACKRRSWNGTDNRRADKVAINTIQRKARKPGLKMPKPTRVRALDEA